MEIWVGLSFNIKLIIILRGRKMPQISKGGKFVFGWSIINPKGYVKIPEITFNEYGLSTDENVILFSGSKTSGGFCVSNRTLINKSIIKGLFVEHPEINDYSLNEGDCVKYKGRLYSWSKIHPEGILRLFPHTMKLFSVKPGDKPLSIRGSNIAFVLAVKGPIIEAANRYGGIIDEYLC